MNTNNFRSALALFAVLCLRSAASAEKAPLSTEELVNQADAIVVATIDDIRIQSEPSTFERAFGNTDWGIYLTLKINAIEKGMFDGETLEARCFRIRTRRSQMEYLTPSGHHPIPENGSTVKAFLKKKSNRWEVILPNGLQPIGGTGSDAKSVTQLWSRRYTYLLPLEGWLLLLIISLPVLICLRWFRSRKSSSRTEQTSP